MFKKQKGMAFISTSPLKSQNKVSKNTNATKQLIKIEPGEYQLHVHFFIINQY